MSCFNTCDSDPQNLVFTPSSLLSLPSQDDEVVLQCVAAIQKENRKFCLAAEGLGNRLCYLEPTSEAKVSGEDSAFTRELHVLVSVTLT